MSVLTLRVDTGDSQTFVTGTTTNDANAENTALNLATLFKALANGGHMKAATVRADVTPVAAAGAADVDDATVNGTVGLVINGVTITVASGTDTGYVVAQAIATAINASSNALVTGLVSAAATNPSLDNGVVTVTALRSALGKSGNCITLAASGTGVTVTTGARLVNGTDGTSTNFTY